MPPTLFDADELAEKLGENRETVMQWARQDYIPSIRVSGRRYFNLSSVVKAIRQRQEAEQQAEAACV